MTGADGRVQRLVDPESFRQAGGPDGCTPVFSAGDTGPGLFNAVYEGLVSGSRDGGAVGIIAFILLTGGAFGIVMATGSVDRALRRLISNRAGDARLTLAVLFVTFSLGGAVFGMGEEAIPFVMMVVPVLARMGYDSATAVLVTYAATQVGFATSWMNPFSVAIAQGIAGLPLLSGMGLRIGMWGVFTLFGVLFLLRHAGRNRVPPERADIAEARPRRWVRATGWCSARWPSRWPGSSGGSWWPATTCPRSPRSSSCWAWPARSPAACSGSMA